MLVNLLTQSQLWEALNFPCQLSSSTHVETTGDEEGDVVTGIGALGTGTLKGYTA